MMKERLDYENQLHNELIFVNNMIYNSKFVKKEKNKEMNKVFIELDKLKHEFDQKKNKCLKKYYSLLEEANLEYDNLVYEKLNETKKTQENKELSEHLKRLERLKSKKIVASELKNLEFMHQNKISSINLEKTKELDEIKKEYNTLFEEIEKRKKLLETEIKIINNELNYYKNINEELQKEYRLYYLDILKKGNDCRKDGLVWVVKNLLELQINLEYHHFPKYLSHEQINYLKSLGYVHYGFYVKAEDKKDLEPRWLSVLDLNGKTEESILADMRSTTRWSINNSYKQNNFCKLKIPFCPRDIIISFIPSNFFLILMSVISPYTLEFSQNPLGFSFSN